MSTAITGVHFVYRPSDAPIERTQALAEVALIHPAHHVEITGIEYSDGHVDELDNDHVNIPDTSFTVSLTWDARDHTWIAAFTGPNGFVNASFASQDHAIAQILNDMLVAGGGDWVAVDRKTGAIA